MEEPPASTAPFRRRAITVGVVTSLLGPLAGGIVFWLMFLLKLVSAGVPLTLDEARRMVDLLLFSAGFAYVFAGLPALLCGIYLGWHTARHGTISRTRTLVASIVATFAGVMLVDAVVRMTSINEGSIWPLLILLVPVAALTSVICREIMVAVGVIPNRLTLPDSTSLADH